jgi:phosphocarrier protein
MQSREITITNKLGLHARAAAKLVGIANGYGAEVSLEKQGQQVNGKSIMGVMMLAASKGSVVQINVTGEGEEEAMQKLVELIEDKFGEGE